MPEEWRERLLGLIKERAVVRGDVVLASGQRSGYYIDGRMIAVSSEGAYWIGEAVYETTRDLEFDAIGGLAVGAIPIITSAVIGYHRHGRAMEGFWVRPQAKEHGLRKRIEGRLPQEARVVMVDDVVTSGGSTFQAIEEAEAQGAKVLRVVPLVDRLAGAAEAMAQRGYRYQPIFTICDLGIEPTVEAIRKGV